MGIMLFESGILRATFIAFHDKSILSENVNVWIHSLMHRCIWVKSKTIRDLKTNWF